MRFVLSVTFLEGSATPDAMDFTLGLRTAGRSMFLGSNPGESWNRGAMQRVDEAVDSMLPTNGQPRNLQPCWQPSIAMSVNYDEALKAVRFARRFGRASRLR